MTRIFSLCFYYISLTFCPIFMYSYIQTYVFKQFTFLTTKLTTYREIQSFIQTRNCRFGNGGFKISEGLLYKVVNIQLCGLSALELKCQIKISEGQLYIKSFITHHFLRLDTYFHFITHHFLHLDPCFHFTTHHFLHLDPCFHFITHHFLRLDPCFHFITHHFLLLDPCFHRPLPVQRHESRPG